MQAGPDKCCNCGSIKITHGRIEEAGFRVKIKWTRVVLSDCIQINGAACLDCGYLSIWVEPEKLKALLGENQTASE